MSGLSIRDFERALDQFFDEMLIAPWRREHPGSEEFAGSQVIDRRNHYEVRIALAGLDPKKIEVEMKGEQLRVCAPAGRDGKIESAYSFAAPIDANAVRARWTGDVLLVTLPKLKPTRIKINDH